MTTRFVMIIEFGQHSARRIAQALERLNVRHYIIRPNETPAVEPTHVILSGGSKHVYEEDHYRMPAWILHTRAPVLGICYGMQLIAHTFGGHVSRMENKQEGPVEVTEIIEGEQITTNRWMNRQDRIVSVPRSFTVTGVTAENHIAAITDNNRWWGVQYHPEAAKYRDLHLFKRFLRRGQVNIT